MAAGDGRLRRETGEVVVCSPPRAGETSSGPERTMSATSGVPPLSHTIAQGEGIWLWGVVSPPGFLQTLSSQVPLDNTRVTPLSVLPRPL